MENEADFDGQIRFSLQGHVETPMDIKETLIRAEIVKGKRIQRVGLSERGVEPLRLASCTITLTVRVAPSSVLTQPQVGCIPVADESIQSLGIDFFLLKVQFAMTTGNNENVTKLMIRPACHLSECHGVTLPFAARFQCVPFYSFGRSHCHRRFRVCVFVGSWGPGRLSLRRA